MASPQLPPSRPTGRLSNSSSYDLASSNSAVYTFLGGRPKSWMNGVSAANQPHFIRSAQRPPTPQTNTQTSVSGSFPGSVQSNQVSSGQTGSQHTYSRPASSESRPRLSNSNSPLVPNLVPPAIVPSNLTVQDSILPSPTLSDENHFHVPSPITTSHSLRHQAVPTSRVAESGSSSNNVVVDEHARKRQRMDSTALPSQPPSTTQSSRDGNLNGQVLAHLTPARSPQSLSHFLGPLHSYVASNGGFAALDLSLELPRVKLLEDACQNEDCFYLVLHQVYCLSTVAPDKLTAIPGFTKEHFKGFSVISYLLLSNAGLPQPKLNWYAQFPGQIEQLLKQSLLYRSTFTEVENCLLALANHWQTLMDLCVERGYPPLVDDLVDKLDIRSHVLQRVAFTAMYRRIWGSEANSVQDQLNSVFFKNQSQYRERYMLAILGRPVSKPTMDQNNQQLAHDYRNVARGFRRQRAQMQMSTPIELDNAPSPSSRAYYLSASLQTPGSYPFQPTPSPAQQVSSYRPPPPATQVNNNPPHVVQVHESGQPLNFPRSTPTPIQQVSRRRGQPPLRPSTSATQLQRNTSMAPTPGYYPQNSYYPQYSGAVSSNVMRPGSVMPLQNLGPRPTTAPMMPPTSSPASHAPPPANSVIPSHGTPLLPPPGHPNPTVSNPNSLVTGLHLAQLCSPPYHKKNSKGKYDANLRLYLFQRDFALAPLALGPFSPTFSFTFNISIDDFQRKAIDYSMDRWNPTTRVLYDGALLFRFRCVKLPRKDTKLDEATWAVSDTAWPSAFYPKINGINLDLRRKFHHGKNLALDLTPHIRAGANDLDLSFLRTEPERNSIFYAIAIEVISVAGHDRVMNMVSTLSSKDSLAAIVKSLNQTIDDDEIEVVDNYISIDLMDPFSAQIFSVPARGKSCLHRECFDLETFVQTRRTKKHDGPTDPDEWRCPICGLDARPQSLMVDNFLQQVLQDLRDTNRLDTKAILVKQDGTWDAKAQHQESSLGPRNPDGIEGGLSNGLPQGAKGSLDSRIIALDEGD